MSKSLAQTNKSLARRVQYKSTILWWPSHRRTPTCGTTATDVARTTSVATMMTLGTPELVLVLIALGGMTAAAAWGVIELKRPRKWWGAQGSMTTEIWLLWQTRYGLLGLADLDTRHKHESESEWCQAHHVPNPIATNTNDYPRQPLMLLS